MTDSLGSVSNSARATVRPPTPESKTPSGAAASVMQRNGHADPVGERLNLEIGWKVHQMPGDIRLRAREEMIEDPQHEPVLHLLALQPQVGRVNRLEVVGFLLRLDRHHGGHAFPGDERRAGHFATGDGLAPSRKKKGAPERAHGADTFMHRIRWYDKASRIRMRAILCRKTPRRQDAKRQHE